jgi:hypothetical protein
MAGLQPPPSSYGDTFLERRTFLIWQVYALPIGGALLRRPVT